MPSARHSHFTSYNRRRVLNDVPEITVKRIEDVLPLEVTLGAENQGESSASRNDDGYCALLNRKLKKAESRERNLMEEIERLKNKLVAKTKRHQTRLDEKEQEYQAALSAKDQEIERLRAALEESKVKKEETPKQGRPTRRRTSRRRSWADKSSQNKDALNASKKTVTVMRGLRSISFTRQPGNEPVSVPRSFSVRSSRRDLP